MKSLDNPPINIRLKLAALWTSVMFCYIYGDYFELYAPGKVEDLMNGIGMLDTPMKLFAASVMLAIPALMISLSIFLKPAISRWLNIIFGVFFTAIMLLIAAGSLTPWYTFYVFLALVESVLTATIVWQAWNWPRAS
ncbi:MAG: DUF6326 family protein [Bacteroidota bacterium]